MHRCDLIGWRDFIFPLPANPGRADPIQDFREELVQNNGNIIHAAIVKRPAWMFYQLHNFPCHHLTTHSANWNRAILDTAAFAPGLLIKLRSRYRTGMD